MLSMFDAEDAEPTSVDPTGLSKPSHQIIAFFLHSFAVRNGYSTRSRHNLSHLAPPSVTVLLTRPQAASL